MNGFLLAQLLNFGIIFLWLALLIVAVIRLRRVPLSDTSRAIWALIVLLSPIIGSMTFLLLWRDSRSAHRPS
jgi:hypothetical protein